LCRIPCSTFTFFYSVDIILEFDLRNNPNFDCFVVGLPADLVVEPLAGSTAAGKSLTSSDVVKSPLVTQLDTSEVGIAVGFYFMLTM